MRTASALVCAGVLHAACSAPSPDEAPDRGPTPSPAELRREAENRDASSPSAEDAGPQRPPQPSASPAELRQAGAPAPPGPGPAPLTDGAPEPPPPGVDAPEPTEISDATAPAAASPPPPPTPSARTPPAIRATPRDQLPPLPFTAYTTAPLTVAGTALLRIGVRVEVVALQGDEATVLCSACPAPATGASGQVPLDRLRAGRAPGGSGDALDTALMLRARWAGGASLPAGATNIEMCSLVDHGFVLDAERATWDHQGAALSLSWTGQVWDQEGDATRPTGAAGWTCRAGGQTPLPSPRSSEAR